MRVHGDIPQPIVDEANHAVKGHRNLGHVLSWGGAAQPSRGPVAVIAQDEYSHDVVMLFSGGVCIVYDVT